jgi:hypothetical protein
MILLWSLARATLQLHFLSLGGAGMQLKQLPCLHSACCSPWRQLFFSLSTGDTSPQIHRLIMLDFGAFPVTNLSPFSPAADYADRNPTH